MKLRIATSVAAAAVLALGVAAAESPTYRRVRELEGQIRAHRPGEAVGHGIDSKGPWARVGDVTARAKGDCIAALEALLAKIGGAP